MLNYKQKIFSTFLKNIVLVTLILWPQLSSAVSPGSMLKDAGDASKLANPSLPEVIGSVINAALGILGTIFLVLIIYAGFTWMTAGGNEEKIQKAQKIMRNSTIGLLIVALAFAITQFVFKTLIEAGL